MNILFVTEDHSIINYGITSMVSQLIDQLSDRYEDLHITVLTMGSSTVKQNNRVNIILVPTSNFGRFWGWSNNLIKTIRQIIKIHKIDIIHIHGVWKAIQWAALMVAREKALPCLLSPHGMFADWFWNNQNILHTLKKKIYLKIVFNQKLYQRITFHAITPAELEILQHQFPANSKVTIPNAIEINTNLSFQKTIHPQRQFLFLGRITPIKAVDLLIDAFNDAKLNLDWKLLIAGPEYVPTYVENLKHKILALGLENRIKFIGPVYDAQKIEILQKSWALVAPSFAEVIGMVNLEAAVLKVPSITTFETGLWDWEEGGGVLIHPNIKELTTALKIASEWSTLERVKRGQCSYKLVEKNYSWDVIVPKWYDLYTLLVENSR